MKQKITVQGTEIVLFQQDDKDFVSLTDIARYKNTERKEYILQNWLRNRETIEFLGLWERINNPNFKHIEFDVFKKEAGLNRFSLTPQRWIKTTNAMGMISKSGRYGGGTFAHKDIAFEFAAWLSTEFKLFLIKEFQRLKEEESERLSLHWDVKRNLARVNYRIHTDAIKNHLIPELLSTSQIYFTYASEADVLNKALFGKTAKEWREVSSNKNGNIRDEASAAQLVCLANLESFNAEFIRQGLSQPERLQRLNEIAISQMRSIMGSPSMKRLESAQ